MANVAKAFKTANYNPAVLKNMKSYLALGDFLWVNRKEITTYTNQKLNGNTNRESYGSVGYSTSDTNTINLIPAARRYEYSRLRKNIDNKLIHGFYIDKTMGITIYITPYDKYDDNEVGIVHVLNYVDADLTKNYTIIGGGKGQFERDTIVKRGWTYTVFVHCAEDRFKTSD